MRSSGRIMRHRSRRTRLPARPRKTKRVDLRSTVTAIPGSDTIMQSTLKAYNQAEGWLARQTVQ